MIAMEFWIHKYFCFLVSFLMAYQSSLLFDAKTILVEGK